MATTGTIAKVSLRSVMANKIRFLLTIISVVLGTAFIAGSFMFTDSLSRTFSNVFTQVYSQVDVMASPREGTRPFTPQTVEELAANPNIASANISDSVTVVFAKEDGTQFSSGGAPSTMGAYYPPEDNAGPQFTITEGNAPQVPDEILLNTSAARKYDIKVGDPLTVVDPVSHRNYRVSGFYDISFAVGGYVGGLVQPQTFVDRYTMGTLRQPIWLKAPEGVSADQLISTLSEQYPQYKFETGQSLADEATKSLEDQLSFLNYFLLAFGLVALLVGTFIIANTFSMIVAQRMREFALLRSLGASRGQLTTSVVLEALLVGVIGSIVGVVAGVGLVHLIYWALDQFDLGIPDAGVSLTAKALIYPLVVGVIVTIISAWAPARRAGKVHPVEAMRSGDVSSSSSLRARTWWGVGVGILGAACAVASVALSEAETSVRASILGAGTVLLILGTFLFLPTLSIPTVPAIGRVIGAPFTSVGRLASTNSRRNPRRTATTAFALTLGVALVSCFGMLGASMKTAVSDAIGDNLGADLIVSGPQNSVFPLPAQVYPDIQAIDGVASSAAGGFVPLSFDKSTDEGANNPFTPIIFGRGDVVGLMGLQVVAGTLDFNQPGLFMDEDTAQKKGLSVGDDVSLYPAGGSNPVKVKLLGTFAFNPVATVLISWSVVENMAKNPDTAATARQTNLMRVLVKAKDGQSVDELRQQMTDVLKPYLVASVLTPAEFVGQQAVMIDQMLSILYGLLALAIVVAMLGIINTLALNVIERRQEIGMLRAIGTHRRQIRTMITLEAIQIAAFGAIVGVVLGAVLGWMFVKILAGEGLNTVTVPWVLMISMLFGSAVVGAIAALWPAHKAARTSPLQAIED